MAGTIITLSSILCDKLNVPMVHCAILLDRSRSRSPGGGGGSTHNGLYGEVSPDKVLNKVCERGAIFQQRVYERGTFFVKNGI